MVESEYLNKTKDYRHQWSRKQNRENEKEQEHALCLSKIYIIQSFINKVLSNYSMLKYLNTQSLISENSKSIKGAQRRDEDTLQLQEFSRRNNNYPKKMRDL